MAQRVLQSFHELHATNCLCDGRFDTTAASSSTAAETPNAASSSASPSSSFAQFCDFRREEGDRPFCFEKSAGRSLDVVTVGRANVDLYALERDTALPDVSGFHKSVSECSGCKSQL